MSAVAAPADRRFRRAHVKPARTRRRLSRVLPMLRYLPVALFAAYGLYLGWKSVAQARVLTIDRIIIRGNERLSENEVLAALSGLRGESLVWADLEEWRQRLLASAWVREASLRRSLPATLEVVVAERQPIGIGRFKNGLYLVDERGTIIDRFGPQYADFDLPIIDGLAAAGGAAPPTADESRAGLAARVIDALESNAQIAGRLSQVDVTDLHNAQVILTGDSAVISLGEERFLERLQSYLEMADALRERVERIDGVDVRFGNRIYVRPAGKQAREIRTKP